MYTLYVITWIVYRETKCSKDRERMRNLTKLHKKLQALDVLAAAEHVREGVRKARGCLDGRVGDLADVAGAVQAHGLLDLVQGEQFLDFGHQLVHLSVGSL